MGESEAEQSFFKRHREGFKDFWAERFSFLENYSRFVNRDEPLPSWSSSDVDQFIASDPIHGPTLKTAREAVSFAITGSVIGAASTAGVAWKYSKSPHGNLLPLLSINCYGYLTANCLVFPSPPLNYEEEYANVVIVKDVVVPTPCCGSKELSDYESILMDSTALSLGAGAVFGFTFGQEVASHWYQLYRLDTMAAQVKFMEWWERKFEGQS
ncbi:hypothetical protein EZV62_011360 [Acer yangbiense]|uniref:Uncharacterized protein n=1 Tax=Acer yangbiense TaxID=1000413 RepID=A0A5C7I7A1_9ROSI|nr:hypothetical protein EZV62_011360 [Acer yangbiense]